MLRETLDLSLSNIFFMKQKKKHRERERENPTRKELNPHE
jgi:hypothetical protein